MDRQGRGHARPAALAGRSDSPHLHGLSRRRGGDQGHGDSRRAGDWRGRGDGRGARRRAFERAHARGTSRGVSRHLPDDCANAADGRGPVLGHRAHDAPVRATLGGELAARRHAARDGGRSARDPCRKARHRRSDGPLRRGADARRGPGHDAVQRRSAGHGGDRLGAGRDSRGDRAGPQAAACSCRKRGPTCRARGSPRGNCTKAACRSR